MLKPQSHLLLPFISEQRIWHEESLDSVQKQIVGSWRGSQINSFNSFECEESNRQSYKVYVVVSNSWILY